MMQSKRYAVTGGIGSGKSAVLGFLQAWEFPVFSCDAISHELWQDEEYLGGLMARFPSCVKGGILQRDALSALVFADEDAYRRLNAYAHPRIMAELMKRTEGILSFSEVPLLFEGGFETMFDGVLAVRRDREARIAAAMRRDGSTREAVVRRMDRQLDPAALDGRCVVLENDATLEELREKTRSALISLGIFR